ncbi:MAG TPA: hypothetical protein VHL34_24605 [Rhizomicrobium sp.]|jgi:hypothetical protein|nr:hypothetical protein [Rhizomicrobium sp.]
MGIPWKKIGKGALKGLGIAAAIDPVHFGPFVPLITLAEKLGGSGSDKKAAVMEALEAEIALLPADKQDEARAAYSAAVDAIVAAKNAEAKAVEAYEKAAAFIAMAKAA